MSKQSTSYGQSLLRAILTASIRGVFLENHRPAWLSGLELDFFYPEHGLAFEFQGDQHFIPVFGVNTHKRQVSNDALKRQLCRENGIVLVYVQAVELKKPYLKANISGTFNNYRPGLSRAERKAWIRSLGIKKKRPSSVRNEIRDAAKTYIQHVRRMGGITAIPKSHHYARATAARKWS